MNLREVVGEIRSRVIREAPDRSAGHAALHPLRSEAAKLRISYQELYATRHVVGRTPPSPKTTRARIGAILVRIVQRMLFWYTPQIHHFNIASTLLAENVCSMAEAQIVVLQHVLEEVAAVRAEMRVRHSGTAAPLLLPAADPAVDLFLLDLRQKLLHNPAIRNAEFEEVLGELSRAVPAPPAGSWLDLGCGRGEWLQALRSRGFDGIGVDSNASAVAYCRELRLPVSYADPLQYLREAGDASLAVITAFGLLERHEFAYVFALVQQAARALKPGGLLSIEAADPSSVVVGAHEFWQDGGRCRPLPPATLRFLVEYFGLRVASLRQCREWPSDRRLPFADLPVVDQLNTLLYGPGAYILITRRDSSPVRAGEARP
jgi:SAM-dependent methyltransferase